MHRAHIDLHVNLWLNTNHYLITRGGFAMPMSMLVLGDSYDYCEGSSRVSSWWQTQLLRQLTDCQDICLVHEKGDVEGGKNWVTRVTLGKHEIKTIAQTGRRSDQLLHEIQREIKDEKYDWVIVGIGVNNQFQYGDNEERKKQYQQDIEKIIQHAIAAANGNSARVIMHSIPYWQVTPAGLDQNTHDYRNKKYHIQKENIKNEIDCYNQIAQSVAEKKGIRFVNITKISEKLGSQPGMVVSDELHYSSKAYEELFIKPLSEAMKKRREKCRLFSGIKKTDDASSTVSTSRHCNLS